MQKKTLVSVLALFSVIAGAVNLPVASAETLKCVHLPQLIEYYLQMHYSRRTLTEEVRTRTVEQMIKLSDPAKSLFLKSDVEQMRSQLPLIFTTMERGQCSAVDLVSTLSIKRAEEDEAFVKKFLGKDYKLDETVELISDPQKRDYSKTQAEKEALLAKMIHFNISSLLLTDVKLDEAKKQIIHRYELSTLRYKKPKAKEDLISEFAEAFASALDPHSSFMSQENHEDFQIAMRLSLEGIGASLSSQDGFTVIEELIPGGGAERLKTLKPKDKIVAVAQDGKPAVSVVDMDLKDVVRMIRGKKGTKVTLTILRQSDTTHSFSVTIVRDKIDVKEQAAKITFEKRKSTDKGGKDLKVAVIDLPSFYGGGGDEGRSSYKDMKTLLKQAASEKADGVVLNLSRNGGGLLEDAVRISGLFMQKGSVVATKDAQGKVQVLADEDPETIFGGPVVVLVSRMSASASEILAGALKDYRRAVIAGSDHSFGKGTVQVLSPLPFNLGAMKVTTGMFFIPAGGSTQHVGVASDIEIPSTLNLDEVGEKELDYSLPTQTIAAFTSQDANSAKPREHWDPVTNDLVKVLASRSKARVSADVRFAEIKKEIEDAQKNKGIIRLAEVRKKTKKPAKDKAERDQKIKDIEQPLIDEGVNIVVDMITEKAKKALQARN